MRRYFVKSGAPGGSRTFHPVSCRKANKVVHSDLDADNILKLYSSACVLLLASSCIPQA